MHYKNLVLSLQYLSSVCDGAGSEDGSGFNKVDTRFGKSLAEQTYQRQLSDSQVVIAVSMLQKYRNQLKNAGIELPHESDFDIETSIKIEAKNNHLLIYIPGTFTKKKFFETVNKVKTIPGREWKPRLNGKPWQIPNNQLSKIRELLPDAELKFNLDELEIEEPEPVKIQPSTISKNGNDYQVYLDKNAPDFGAKLNAVRKLANREWMDGFWLVSGIDGIATLVEQHDYQLDAATKADLNDYEQIKNRTVAPDDFTIPGVHGSPYPFQMDGVWLAEKANGRLIVGDDMGLGKTMQALMYLQLHPELRPAVIVVPATVKTHWKRQYRQWLKSNDRIEVLSGTKPKLLPTADVYIINYDILRYWLPLLKQARPQVIISDESHMLKNPKAARTKAFDSLAKQCKSVLLLTGTAIQNRPAELWKLLNLVNRRAWPSFYKFAHRYCDAKKQTVRYRDKKTGKIVRREIWDFSGASNLKELHERIKPYFIRRLKKDVLNLGEKSRITVPLDVPDSKLKNYHAAMRAALERLRKEGKEDAAQLVLFEKAKQAAFDAKVDAVIEWVQNLLDSDRKLVLFCIHKEAVKRLKSAFSEVSVSITGETSQKNRVLAVDRFQHDDNCRLLIGNVQAAGVGITLTAASDVAFAEFDWTPSNHVQAEDRCYRIGQDAETVQAWYLVLPDTIEEQIVNLLYEKSVIVSAVLDGTEDHLENASIFGEFLELVQGSSI